MQIPASAFPQLARHRTNEQTQNEAAFVQSLVQDYDELLPHFPPKVDRILDIGCGLAGIDVLLKRLYPDAQLYLLDGDGDETRRGWNETLGAFSSRAAAEELLAANGVKADRWYDVNTKEHLEADLVISLASWGFHYPIRTYTVSGFCIADLRKVMEPVRGHIITEYPKRFRCKWRMLNGQTL